MVVKKVALVTGANRGIGLDIVRLMSEKFDGDVYLTARDETLGQEAVEKLKGEGLTAKFHQLDISDPSSIQQIRRFLEDNYGGLDVLINNAGIAFKHGSEESFLEQAEVTIKVNFWATLDVCTTLFPILRSHARVVNVSSLCSFSYLRRISPEAQERVLACKTMEHTKQLMKDFVEEVRAESWKASGWYEHSYGMSKLGVTVMSLIQQRDIDKDKSRQDIIINACCPGWCATDMSSFKGPKSSKEGADTPVYLALLPENIESPRGKYVTEREIKEWCMKTTETYP